MSESTGDALANILKTINLSATTYICQGVGSDWYLQMRYLPQGLFHVVLEGQCYLREASIENPRLLKAGDVVAFPTGGAHWISDNPNNTEPRVENLVRVGKDNELMLLKSGRVAAFPTGSELWKNSVQDHPADFASPSVSALENFDETDADFELEESQHSVTTLLTGTLSYDTTLNHPFLKDLPCFITISNTDDSELSSLRTLVALLEKESKQTSPGSSMVLDRLTEILFIQLIRAHVEQMEKPSGYIAALSDPKIGLALNLMHAESDENWTIESLCKTVGLSRTAFTLKFSKLVGINPKAYLTSMRMLNARTKLQFSDASMLSIAAGAGYSSEASFSKAIKKHFNLTPGQIRRSYRSSKRQLTV